MRIGRSKGQKEAEVVIPGATVYFVPFSVRCTSMVEASVGLRPEHPGDLSDP